MLARFLGAHPKVKERDSGEEAADEHAPGDYSNITGASAGLGRAIALEFGKAGANVGLIARDAAALETTAAEVERKGGVAAIYVAETCTLSNARIPFEAGVGRAEIVASNAAEFQRRA